VDVIGSNGRVLASSRGEDGVEILLHTGHEHPELLWIAVSAVVSFALGVGVGAYGPGTEPDRTADATPEEE
jgi:hypothetical protein